MSAILLCVPRCAQQTKPSTSTTRLPIHFQNGIDDARTQKDDYPERTTDVGRQFPRELFGWWWRRIGVSLRVGALFFQFEYGRPFVLGVVCDAVLSQYDKGRVVLLVPLLDLKGTVSSDRTNKPGE